MKKKKKLFFQLIFSTYLHVALLKFRSGALVGWEIKFHIQRVPTWHTFGGPHSMKNKKYMKKCDHHHVFSCISCFSWSGVHQKYAMWVHIGCGIDHHHVFSCISLFSWIGVHQKYAKWVLVGCGIKFPIQLLFPAEI